MTITKVDETFFELTKRRLMPISQLQLFSILKDHDRETLFMNIFRSHSIELGVTSDVIFYDTYEVGSNPFWDNISNEIYGTPYLWWALAIFNNVVNPFEELEEGSNINYLRNEYIYVFMKDIERLAELG
jgi:hypothetical protein